MSKFKIITEEQWCSMSEQELRSGREYLHWDGYEERDGLLFSVYLDKRLGKRYGVRTVRSVHMGFNSNEEGKVEEFVAIVEREGACKATWGVTGRTMHQILAGQLAKLLPQYEWEIGYNYECKATRRDQA